MVGGNKLRSLQPEKQTTKDSQRLEIAYSLRNREKNVCNWRDEGLSTGRETEDRPISFFIVIISAAGVAKNRPQLEKPKTARMEKAKECPGLSTQLKKP